MTPSPNQAIKQNQEKALMESWTHVEKKLMEVNLHNIIAKNLSRVLQTVCPLILRCTHLTFFCLYTTFLRIPVSLLTCGLGLWEVFNSTR